MGRAERFWDGIAEKYAADPVTDEAAYQVKLEASRTYFTRESSILEFGCGTGTTALLHAPYVGRYLAVDLSSEMVRIAREKAAAEAVNNVTFLHSSIEDLVPPEPQYDVIMCHSVLHLLDEPEGAIGKIAGLLKPGGVFISSTFCMKALPFFLRPLLTLGQWIGKVPPVSYFSAPELEAAMVEAGLEIVHKSRPGDKRVLFLVARRPAEPETGL